MDKFRALSISHTDLDGYASQYFVAKKLANLDLTMVNLDYHEIPKFIADKNNFVEYDLVVITDLNLKPEDADMIENYRLSIGFDLTLFDHHKSDVHCLQYPWYNVNTAMCATLFTYNMLQSNGLFSAYEQKFAELVNIHDTWKVEDFPVEFQKATFISDVVYTCPLVFSKRDFIFQYFDLLIADEMLNAETIDLERHFLDSVHNLYKNDELVQHHPSKQKIIRFDKPAFIEYVKTHFFTSKQFGGVKIVHTQVPSTNFQYLSHMLTEDITEPIVMINANPKGSASVRGNTDQVFEIAKYFGGGGHPRAGGFVIKDFAEFLERLESIK